MEDDLRKFLLADTGVAAKVGERVYPDVLPNGATLPAIVYQRVSTPRTPRHGEASSFPRPRLQLRIWAKTRKASSQTANAVRSALDGYKGRMGSTDVTRCVIVDERGEYDPETELRPGLQEYQITYNE
jgi:hypothetical protein